MDRIKYLPIWDDTQLKHCNSSDKLCKHFMFTSSEVLLKLYFVKSYSVQHMLLNDLKKSSLPGAAHFWYLTLNSICIPGLATHSLTSCTVLPASSPALSSPPGSNSDTVSHVSVYSNIFSQSCHSSATDCFPSV